MFLEYWMIGVMMTLFAVGIHRSFVRGRDAGSEVAAATTIEYLVDRGIVSLARDPITGEKIVIKALPTNEEYAKMLAVIEKVHMENKDES